MADTDGQTETASARARSKAEAAINQAGQAGEAAVQEARSFAEAGRQTARRATEQALGAAESGLKAGQDMAAASHDAARRAGGQAVELWRASLDPLANMQTEFGRWMEQTWRQSLSGRLQGDSLLAAISGGPAADLYQTDDGAELAVELPGLSAQDVTLSLRGAALTVAGERSQTSERDDGAYRVRERRSGRFQRTFQLPEGADLNRIEARFDNGVLRVSIPLASGPDSAPKTIPIKG